MRFCERVINLQRFECQFLTPQEALPRRKVTFLRSPLVGVGQSTISQRIIWVYLKRLIEMLDAFSESFFCSLARVVAPQQVEPVRICVICVAFCQRLLLLPGQPQRQ